MRHAGESNRRRRGWDVLVASIVGVFVAVACASDPTPVMQSPSPATPSPQPSITAVPTPSPTTRAAGSPVSVTVIPQGTDPAALYQALRTTRFEPEELPPQTTISDRPLESGPDVMPRIEAAHDALGELQWTTQRGSPAIVAYWVFPTAADAQAAYAEETGPNSPSGDGFQQSTAFGAPAACAFVPAPGSSPPVAGATAHGGCFILVDNALIYAGSMFSADQERTMAEARMALAHLARVAHTR